MASPAQQLADHYSLDLSSAWREWFDHELHSIALPGAMRNALTVDDLIDPTPAQIWPGFMLPDTLPLIGNDYGDWICVRVDEDDRLGELLYWYHGGGDWIPIGDHLAEAVMHDFVDQFRQLRVQMLRGASESRFEERFAFLDRFHHPHCQQWLVERLAASEAGCDNREQIAWIGEFLAAEDYWAALNRLRENGWARDAVACDLIDSMVQSPVQDIAHKDIAQKVGLAWYPDFINLLFDVSQAPEAMRTQILAHCPTETQWPVQDWAGAASIAGEVLQRRHDLGWAATVAGWQAERQGDVKQAVETYSKVKYASSFAEQAVRFNCHAIAEEHGKFAMSRLVDISRRNTGQATLAGDPYVAIFKEPSHRSLLSEVSDFWRHQAQQAATSEDAALRYTAIYRAGWDMGISRLGEYSSLLSELSQAARSAGCEGRAAVADAHRRCLTKRTG